MHFTSQKLGLRISRKIRSFRQTIEPIHGIKMRVRQRLVVSLFVFVFLKGFLLASADDKQPIPSFSSANNELQRRDVSTALKKSEKPKQGRKIHPYVGGHTHDKRGLTKRWLPFEQKARKLSVVATSSLVEENTTNKKENNTRNNEHSRNASSTNTSSQATHQTADYGILGISEDEDSAKWALDEMRKVAENKTNSHDKEIKQNVSTVASTLRIISSKNQSQYVNRPVKIILINSGGNMSNALTQTKNLNKSNRNQDNENLFKNLKPDKADAEPISMKVNTSSSKLEKTGKDTAGVYKIKSPLIVIPESILQQADPDFKQNKTASSSSPPSSTAQKIKTSTHNDTTFIKTVLRKDSGANQTKALDNTTTNLTGPQKVKGKTQNVSVSETVLHLSELGSKENNTSGNATPMEEQNSRPPSLSGMEPVGSSQKSNQSQNNEELALYPKAPSLEVNISSLRKGQSFDFQIPSTIPLKSSDQSNHIHIEPDDTLNSSEYLPKDIESNSSNSNFLNDTLNKVLLEELVRTEKSNKLLQKFNSDILASKAKLLFDKVNLGSEVNDQTFREESSADRTFSENILEPYSNEALLTRRLNNLQGRQRQTEVQQDESLAKALNSSSVSSIIFSANRALFDTDQEVFSKKSSQGRLKGAKRDKDHRHKRSYFWHRLTKHQGTNRLGSNADYLRGNPASRRNKKQRKATARQVINLGNHFLWFGGQSSADANGFPRHNTATENNAFSVNNYISNFLSSAKDKKTPSATKGYRALQSALTSMESNQDSQADTYNLDSMYTEPVEKQWEASDSQKATANEFIQDGTGKAVYQSMVDKSNETKTQVSSNSVSDTQSNNEFIDHGAPIKENRTNREHTEPEFAQQINENSTSAINNTSRLINSDQKSVNEGNITILQNLTDSMGHLGETNSAAPGGGIQLSEQSMTTVQSKMRDSPKLPNVTADSEKAIKQQPSAIIKKISTNSQEPETYHVIVNDAGKKITNANGHVTVIISGPTATQASMPDENTLLIPQTSPSQFLRENEFLPTNDRERLNISHSAIHAVNKTSVDENKGNGTRANKQIAPLSLLQEDIAPALKISEDIEEHLKHSSADSALSTSQKEENELPKQTTDARVLMDEKDNFTSNNREESTHNGHHFFKVGQDLTSNIGDLQMEEVSRPDLQEAQQKVQEKLAEDSAGGFLLGGDQFAAQQAQDVPTLNIVLNPMQRIDGSLSVGGKVIPIGSAKEGYSKEILGANEQGKQKLDCHADTKNEKAGTTMLTCQKKHDLANFLPAFQGIDYSGNLKAAGSPGLQLDQVMNVLNDQVKTTINKEMKTESKDIEDVLKDMTMPSSTLMDTEEAYSQEEPPEHSSLMDTDETFTSHPGFVRQTSWKNNRHHHQKIQPFGFFHGFGLSHHLGFRHHLGIPNRRHFWGYNRHPHPFVVMAHKDSDEGFWDYQHNIFIPRGFSHFSHDDDDDDDDDEGVEVKKAKHWVPWSRHGHRRGTWLMAHPPFHPRHHTFPPFSMPVREQNLAHFRLPTIFSRSGPWRPLHSRMTVPQSQKEEKGSKRTAVVHKTIRGDRDLCRPIIGGPSPPLKGEWEYLGKVLSSCPCRLMDTEW